jgi:VCBS repeat-containing protein
MTSYVSGRCRTMSTGGFQTNQGSEQFVVLNVAGDGAVVVPNAALLFSAEFQRDGSDLLLVNDGADTIRIPDYFSTMHPPALASPEGATLSGDTVARLAGPLAPGQYAQTTDLSGGSPIGQVETLQGNASVQRSDGVVEALQIGGKIYQNDVVQTDAESTLAVTFVDGTIFTLASNSRMIIDELIFDPERTDNSGAFNLVQGSFVFIAGQVAKTGGMDVSTPSATMGIRGTTVLVDVQVENGIVTTEVALTIDPDGGHGRIELFDLDGGLIANIIGTDTTWIVSPVQGETREIARTAADDATDNILIADAFTAYYSAFSRVEQGQTFVQLGRQSNSSNDGSLPAQSDTGLGVDSIDDPEKIKPPENVPKGDTEGDGPSFDEGRLNQPLAPNIIVTGAEDSTAINPITGAISSGFPSGASLTFALVGTPGHGAVSVLPDGSFVYTPVPDFNGTDGFLYTATDASGYVATGKVTVRVSPVNDAPIAIDAAFSGVEDSTVLGVVKGTDVDGDTLTFSLSTGAANGTVVVVSDGSFSYTPNKNYNGTDSFVVQTKDPTGASDFATVSLTISGVNDPPVITTAPGANIGSVTDGSASTVAFGALTATDSDAGQTFVWSGSKVGAYGALSIAANGVWSYTLNSAAAKPLADGQVVTDSFTATVTDDQGGTATQVIRLTITGANDGPLITTSPSDASGALTEDAGTGIATGKLSSTDPDTGATAVWSGSANGAYGSIAIAADGTWTYTLDQTAANSLAAGSVVTDTFTATVTDDQGQSASQLVTMTITGTNDAPIVAQNTIVEATANSAISGTLVAADVDSSSTFTFAQVGAGPQHGTLTVDADGSFIYTPTAGYQGLDQFQYSATDDAGATSTGTVTLEVESASSSDPNGQTATLDINTFASLEFGAGSVNVGQSAPITASINLSIALDQSVSIGSQSWIDQVNAVSDALTTLAQKYAGSSTTIDVQLITFSKDTQTYGPFDLHDPAIQSTLANLSIPTRPENWGTKWGKAFDAAHDFFDNQPHTETNYLYFITDGIATDRPWEASLANLIDADTNGFSVNIEVFGIGDNLKIPLLNQIDPTPTILESHADLSAALTETPIFNFKLIGFELKLDSDGVDHGVIATENSPALIQNGTDYDIAFADIDGIENLIGETNRFSATVKFDLDNDPTTAEVELFSTDVFAKAEDPQILAGSEKSDLLLGSDAADTLSGGDGNDLLLGYGGDDVLDGGTGANMLFGGAGDDRLIVTADGAGSLVDGGAGRDILQLDASGDLNALLPVLDIRGIEAIDMENGQTNTLTLGLSDILNLSDTPDTDLETLLSKALPESVTIYGDVGDALQLTNGQTGGFVAGTGPASVNDGSHTLNIYHYMDGGSILATLAVDADVTVSIQAGA